ncbi:Copper-exporting P-type ATPase A [Pirellulimonas nuda]|uniref:Copper-exporting P-type ATPase A n=1 Tax=Pirellulimonas nuda TaxID=2528009 RepID=A0A518DHS5_9BACT|nr:heavy metal translocating P-type ATPase [Pirellulimonas nuda]QDU91030.1 Copper-exporting P-type ATPase A [Pirellulimonas nuda]
MSTASLEPEAPPTAPAPVCDHCGLKVPTALFEPDAPQQFCCGGCQMAYETIRGCGLEDYYAMRDRFAQQRHAASGARRRYAAYDSEAFLAKHAVQTPNGLRAIELRLEGVHCAACVWLVERLPRVVPGVVEARLTLGASRARVVWDPQQANLSTIAAALDHLGYAPHPARDASARAVRNAAERRRLVNLAIAGALAGNNMLIAVALYAGVFEGIEPQFVRLFRWLSLAIGWLSLVWPGAVFFRGAWAGWRVRAANLDQPIALALGVGALAGTANVLLDRGEVYFDSLSTLVFLLLVGRFLQARQQRWAEEAVGLLTSMTPDTCRVVRDGLVLDESVEALTPGDAVEVRPGELFPADGRVLSGASAVDQSLLTGETLPTPVAAGDGVCAGAQNIAATLRVRVGAVGEATRVAGLVRMVEAGLAAKPPIVEFADRVAGWFVAAVAVLATLNFICWWGAAGLAPAIDTSVALLIVACPCALGLATPLTMAVAIARGSKQGMLIKSAAVLQRLAGVRPASPGVLLLDKTGTLTRGDLRLEAYSGDAALRRWVAALEAESNHPIAVALQRAFGPVDPANVQAIQDRTERHGFGVSGLAPVGTLLVGSPRYASELGVRMAPEIEAAIELGQERGHTVVVIAVEGAAAGVVWLSDRLHEEAAAGVAWLVDAGWQAQIISGDAQGPVRQAARCMGLPPSAAHGEVSPEEKLARVRAAAAGPGAPAVMMVGDGVNDAAALAAADIGVAVHGGAEASLAAADVYLTEPGVGALVELVQIGRQTMRVARRNLAISLCYNALAVTLAAAGLITPLVAALLMPASSATVLASAVGFQRRPRG